MEAAGAVNAGSEPAVSAFPGEEANAPFGYTLVLPPGWSRTPLRRGTEQADTPYEAS